MHNWIHLFEFGMRLCNKYSTVNNFNKPACNWLYPDQNRRSVGTELGPNYLQMLSADKKRVGNLGNNKYKSG